MSTPKMRLPAAVLLVLLHMPLTPVAAQPTTPPSDEADATWQETAQRACDGGDALFCHLLAVDRVQRLGAVDDEALRLFTGACGAGQGLSCWWLGVALRDNGQSVEAFAQFLRGCEAADGLSCGAAGEALDSGSGTPPDQAAAARYFHRGCDLGDATSCWKVGRLAEACDLGDHHACAQIAIP
jgi:hypothetical protein